MYTTLMIFLWKKFMVVCMVSSMSLGRSSPNRVFSGFSTDRGAWAALPIVSPISIVTSCRRLRKADIWGVIYTCSIPWMLSCLLNLTNIVTNSSFQNIICPFYLISSTHKTAEDRHILENIDYRAPRTLPSLLWNNSPTFMFYLCLSNVIKQKLEFVLLERVRVEVVLQLRS